MEKIHLKSKFLEMCQLYNCRGCEAEIYKFKNEILKVYRKPSKNSILNKYLKLNELDKIDLPETIIRPKAFLYLDDQISGLVLPFVDTVDNLYTIEDKDIRTRIDILKIINNTLKECHKKELIISDFNPNNILIKDNIPYHIDIDSCKYQGYKADASSELLYKSYYMCDNKVSKNSDIFSLAYYTYAALTGDYLPMSTVDIWKYIIKDSNLNKDEKNYFTEMNPNHEMNYLDEILDNFDVEEHDLKMNKLKLSK